MSDEVRTILLKLCASGGASAIAECATFPLDLTKTRLQVQGEVASNGHGAFLQKHGMIRTAYSVVTKEGITKLWSGVQPAVYRHIIYTSIRTVLYEKLRDDVFGRRKDGSFPVWKAALVGAISGAVGQLIASPMDLLKVRMQLENSNCAKLVTHNTTNSVNHALCLAYKSGGLKGLWAGWVPNVQRAALVNIGNLTTYDVAKQNILRLSTLKDNWVCHMLASTCSGFAAAVLGTPADVIKTRMMNQARDKQGKGVFYTSSFDCLTKTLKQEGVLSLYKGFVPIWSRIAPWSVIFWIMNEEIRKAFGIHTF